MGTMSGTVSVTIVWHILWNKSITSKHFWQKCITNRPSFVQVDLPAKQNGNGFPVVPGNCRKLPVRPYLFVTFKAKKYVLMWDGYKLTDVHRGKTGKKSRYPCRRSGKDTGNGIWGDLLGAQGLDGVALGCAAGRDDAGQNGQQGGQRHEEEGRVHGQGGHEG